eukprot:TRINITY_DN9277_c0_g1_i1.p1 TRINITY_DN9277_c0_g1~~TRINITY_DN9277_c0_g1_i1.p1  ORF type:complete len:143 (-),score=30.06 TRINITY_DN9277_c0_g1_i1:122-550(-)
MLVRTTGVSFSLDRQGRGYVVISVGVSPIGWHHSVGVRCSCSDWRDWHAFEGCWVHNDAGGEEIWEVALCVGTHIDGDAAHKQIAFAAFATDLQSGATVWDNNGGRDFRVTVQRARDAAAASAYAAEADNTLLARAHALPGF